MKPSDVKKFIGKIAKVEILDHASYNDSKDVNKEIPVVITSYGVVKIVRKDAHDRWFLNISYDETREDGRFVDESGSTYLLTDVLSITELHQ